MQVISVVRKYLIQDLTGLISNYYIQESEYYIGTFGCWKDGKYSATIFQGACDGSHKEMLKRVLHRFKRERRTKQSMYEYIESGLITACIQGKSDIVRFLIKKGGKRSAENLLYLIQCSSYGKNWKIFNFLAKLGIQEKLAKNDF